MSEQEGDGRRQKRQLNEGGTELNVTVVSEEMMDKLRILNYEQEYCNRKQIDVFHQHYFTIADNQAKQFSDFVSLVSWLMRLQNVSFNVDKYDDANTSVNNLMMTLRSMDFSVDFPPAKLRNGAGVEVCAVVSFLCDRVLENQRFQFSTPNYPAEELSEQAEVEDDADGAVEEENMGGGGRGGMPNDSDGEEEVMYSEQLRSERKDEDEEDDAAHAKLETDIDPLIWQTELERVAPHLKVKKIHGGKEWRAHIELTKKHGDNVNRILPESRKKLAMISDAIKTSMERLQGKERYLNSHFDGKQSRRIDAWKMSILLVCSSLIVVFSVTTAFQQAQTVYTNLL